MKLEVDIKEITWICSECKNRYEYRVEYCPNIKLDEWIIKQQKQK